MSYYFSVLFLFFFFSSLKSECAAEGKTEGFFLDVETEDDKEWERQQRERERKESEGPGVAVQFHPFGY